MAPDSERERLIRLNDRAVIKRDGYVMRIRSIHAMANRCLTDGVEHDQLLVVVDNLDKLWSCFELEDNAILDFLCELGLSSEYSNDLNVEISELITFCRFVRNQCYENRSVYSDGLAHQKSQLLSFPHVDPNVPNGHASKHPLFPVVRLPEIPLPTYDGDIYKWPLFSDRFTAMVDHRSDLSDIDKSYYLMSCLKGNAAEALRGIPVSGLTYRLAWSTLKTQFDKPRLVAGSLVDNLFNAPIVVKTSMSNQSTDTRSTEPRGSRKMTRSHTMLLVAAAPSPSQLACKYGDGSHTLESCNKFRALSVDDRIKFLRSKRLCFLCFGDKH